MTTSSPTISAKAPGRRGARRRQARVSNRPFPNVDVAALRTPAVLEGCIDFLRDAQSGKSLHAETLSRPAVELPSLVRGITGALRHALQHPCSPRPPLVATEALPKRADHRLPSKATGGGRRASSALSSRARVSGRRRWSEGVVDEYPTLQFGPPAAAASTPSTNCSTSFACIAARRRKTRESPASRALPSNAVRSSYATMTRSL